MVEYLDETLAEKEGRPETLPDVPEAAGVSEFIALWWLAEDVSGGGDTPKEGRVLAGGSPEDSRFGSGDG